MDEEDEIASHVRVKDFVEQRAVQIADLLNVVDNSRLVSGEVTKGPRTAAQRLPRHMRRRAMAYEIRRFPKGLRTFAGAFLLSNHRKKPPCRYYRRRSRNLLLNYIRRQRKAVWLETHIWHAKRFHMVQRWGYQLPDRSFQRNFRPIYRNSMQHCTIRDKSYLNCILIFGKSQEDIIEKLKPFCNSSASPTFAFKSGLNGLMEVSTLLFKPHAYPADLIGPASSKTCLALWVHPTSKEELLSNLTASLGLSKLENLVDSEESVPTSYEEWRLENSKINTDVYKSRDESITIEDLKDQLVRFRFYGPKSLDVVKNSIQLSSCDQETYGKNHEEWNKLASCGEVHDSRVFSLLIEDPRISYPKKPAVPASQMTSKKVAPAVPTVSNFWKKDIRIEALKSRLTDVEMNKLKGDSIADVNSTPAKIPILIVIRSSGTGKQEALEGVEVIAPTGFGRDLWVSAQLRTAHASGLRDDLAAHLEAGVLAFPADYLDSSAGKTEEVRIDKELEGKHARRPFNRRVLHWKHNSIKFPFTFELNKLVSEWSGSDVSKPYYLRDRRALLDVDAWLKNSKKFPVSVLSENKNALIILKLSCIARGKPKRFGVVCIPQKEDLKLIRECQCTGKPFLLKEPRKKQSDSMEVCDTNGVEKTGEAGNKNIWKDVVSLDPATREKPISLKTLFPESKNIDKKAKRKLLNKKKREAKKRRVEVQQARLSEFSKEEEEKRKTSYRNAGIRETVGRVLRGDFSFTEARGIALCVIPLCALPEIVSNGGTLLVRNITSQYYHPINVPENPTLNDLQKTGGMFSFLARLSTPTSSTSSTPRSSFSPRSSIVSPGLNASFASDPTQWESTFDKCWAAVERILEKKVAEPDHIVPYEELSHLLSQLTQMNQLLMMEINSQPEPIIGPILDRYFTQQIMERVLDWSIQIPDGTRSICQLGLIRIYEAIVGESYTKNHCLLVHKPILNPLLRLFNWCKRIEALRPSITGEPSVNDKHFVLLLNQICKKLSEDRTLLHFFFNSEQFSVFTLLIPFLYEQNDVGQLARDAVLLILSVAKKHDAIAEFIALKSDFCPVVATGLSGCFSQLPRILTPEGSDRIVPEHSTDALNNYNAAVLFCNAVAQDAHPLVVSKICSFFYSGFLISVVKPALLQEEREAVAASTMFLQICLSQLTEPSLVQTVVRMLLVERDEKATPLIEIIVERIQGHDRMASASVQLLDTLSHLICEDVMLMLALRNILSLRYSRHQLNKIYDTNYTQDLAKKILECVPDCMLKVQDMCSQETVSLYIEEGAELVNSFASGCSAWKWRYDGIKPNPSIFRSDSDDDTNLTTLSRMSSFRSSMNSGRGLNRYAASRASHLTAESTLGALVDLGGEEVPEYTDNYDEIAIEEDEEFILPPVSMSASMVDYFQLAAFDDLSEGDEVNSTQIQISNAPAKKKSEAETDSDTAMARSFVLSGWSEIEDMDTFLSLLDRQPMPKNPENSSIEECVNYIASRQQYWDEFNPKIEEESQKRRVSTASSGYLDSNMMFGLPIDVAAEPSLFLDLILMQLEIMYDHSLTYNLHFTSLLSSLIAYPLPLLLVYLFQGRKTEGKLTLLEILIKLKKKIDELTSNIDGLDVWVGRALRTLHARYERAERIGEGHRFQESPHRNDDISPISSFVRNTRLGGSGRKSSGIRYHIHKAVESAETIRDDERIKNIVHAAIILSNLVQLLSGIVLHQSLAVVRQR